MLVNFLKKQAAIFYHLLILASWQDSLIIGGTWGIEAEVMQFLFQK